MGSERTALAEQPLKCVSCHPGRHMHGIAVGVSSQAVSPANAELKDCDRLAERP